MNKETDAIVKKIRSGTKPTIYEIEKLMDANVQFEMGPNCDFSVPLTYDELQARIKELTKELSTWKESSKADIERSNNAFNQVAELTKELELHRWIPVGERLPKLFKNIPYPHSKDVLVLFKTGHWYKAYYDGEANWVVYSSHKNPVDYQESITHWEPIALPEKEKESGSRN